MMRLQYGLAVIMLLLCGSERAHAADQFALCRPVEVMAHLNRVHVLCELPVAPNIVFLAASAEPDSRFATRVVALGAVAQATQKTLLILFDPADSTTGPAFGCLAQDCRPLKAFAITERSPPTPTSPPTSPPVCSSSEGQPCGNCGGVVQCDGTCSTAFGRACSCGQGGKGWLCPGEVCSCF